MVVLADALDGTVSVRVGAAGAEVAGGIVGLAGGKKWARDGLDGKDEEDVDDLRDEADLDGPRWEATTAARSMRLTKRLNSYLSGGGTHWLVSARSCQSERDHLPRMNFSTSLSRSRSIIFAGGGWRTSSGLYISLDLMFPTCRMC